MSADYPCAVPDWAARLREGRSIIPPLSRLGEGRYSEELAAEGLGLWTALRLGLVPGHPYAGEYAANWIRDIVYYWFGAQTPDGAERTVKDLLILVSKKNTKTTSAALLMLAQMVLSKRANAESLILAPTKEVADLAFRTVAQAIRLDPQLAVEYDVSESARVVRRNHPQDRRLMRVVAAETTSIAGTTATYILLDELHLWVRSSRGREVVTHVFGARVGQPDAGVIMVSTHAHEESVGLWREQLGLFRQTRDGKLDSPRLFAGYEWPAEEQKARAWEKDPSLWRLTNPNMGVLRGTSLDEMRRARSEAEVRGPEAVREWDNQFLNVELEGADGTELWAAARYWPQCADPGLGGGGLASLEKVIDRSNILVCGVDGGGLDDLLALCVLGKESRTNRWLVWVHVWAHRRLVLARYPGLTERLSEYERQGDLTWVDFEDGSDHSPRRRAYHPLHLDQLGDMISYVHSVGISPKTHAVGIDDLTMVGLTDAILDEALPSPPKPAQLARVRQGYRLMGVINSIALKAADGTLAHCGQPILGWAVGNCRLVPRGNAMTIDKAVSGRCKIDPAMAMLMAGEMLQRIPEARQVGVAEVSL